MPLVKKWQLDEHRETINDHEDVEITSPADGQALVYDGAAQKWKNQSVGGAGPVTIPIGHPRRSWVYSYGTRFYAFGGNTTASIDDQALLRIPSGTVTRYNLVVISNSLDQGGMAIYLHDDLGNDYLLAEIIAGHSVPEYIDNTVSISVSSTRRYCYKVRGIEPLPTSGSCYWDGILWLEV